MEEQQQTPLISKATAIVLSIVLIVVAAGIGGVVWWQHGRTEAHNTHNVVEPQEFNHPEGQQHLPDAQMVTSVGKGTVSVMDHRTKKQVNAELVGIDAQGDQYGATLAPPERIDQVGWYVGSAGFGEEGKGSTVLTSHVDYQGAIGFGSMFPALKVGDQVVVTDFEGNEHYYLVNQEPFSVHKDDPDYAAKTQATINKVEGENVLVMVTCFGQYVGGALGYEDNSITVAVPVPLEQYKVQQQ